MISSVKIGIKKKEDLFTWVFISFFVDTNDIVQRFFFSSKKVNNRSASLTTARAYLDIHMMTAKQRLNK